MNLNNINVQELNEQEMKNTEGGIGILGAACVVLAVVYLASSCYALSQGKKLNGMP